MPFKLKSQLVQEEAEVIEAKVLEAEVKKEEGILTTTKKCINSNEIGMRSSSE